MKTPFIPTAMRCNKEQFEAIKPKLIERGCDLSEDDFNGFNGNYLVNNFFNQEKLIGLTLNLEGRTLLEWNEEIFLRNLGGEDVEEKAQEIIHHYEPTYDRGMMAATILSAMITQGYTTDYIYNEAVEHTDKLIDRLNQTL